MTPRARYWRVGCGPELPPCPRSGGDGIATRSAPTRATQAPSAAERTSATPHWCGVEPGQSHQPRL